MDYGSDRIVKSNFSAAPGPPYPKHRRDKKPVANRPVRYGEPNTGSPLIQRIKPVHRHALGYGFHRQQLRWRCTVIPKRETTILERSKSQSCHAERYSAKHLAPEFQARSFAEYRSG